ncbi:MAG: hypothetical protein K2X50_01115 [Gammaproteobacteria bacterium]|nr:hypothetical protein [Gammaproteobacteria bacterium]
MNDKAKPVSTENEVQQLALQWLSAKWPDENRVCEICNSKNWNIAQDLVTPIRFKNGTIFLDGPSYPQIVVVCNNCGNTKYFNAMIAGMIKMNDIDSGEQNVK